MRQALRWAQRCGPESGEGPSREASGQKQDETKHQTPRQAVVSALNKTVIRREDKGGEGAGAGWGQGMLPPACLIFTRTRKRGSLWAGLAHGCVALGADGACGRGKGSSCPRCTGLDGQGRADATPGTEHRPNESSLHMRSGRPQRYS